MNFKNNPKLEDVIHLFDEDLNVIIEDLNGYEVEYNNFTERYNVIEISPWKQSIVIKINLDTEKEKDPDEE